MIEKLLIANRGEIACRIMRTAKRMGIATVAVYSDADASALHVRTADEAVRIGPSLAAASYLNIEAIMLAARKTGADAIHPGYGFLSENADFAEAVTAAGLVFVGPPAEAIRVMGDKARAKEIADRLNIPIIRGYAGENQTEERFALEARIIGYPLMVKALAGGGGRGMRIVERFDALPAAIESARREAESAFGDGTLLLERFVPNGRHVEMQVFADARGNAIHLGERDCSVQRRHQKVIEEAPSPFVDEYVRMMMGQDAVRLAQAVGYIGAGTVEFIVGDDHSYYFLEMNTRLQVEHPVTEMVVRQDLVEWQLRIAAGSQVPRTQEEILIGGHAIEARLYAEDPYHGFAPQTGKIAFWRPAAGDGLRIDAGVEEGDTVSPHYDPMIAKLIAHGPTREEARTALLAALRKSPLFGVITNRSFLIDLLETPEFREREFTTKLIDGWSEKGHDILRHRAPSSQDWANVAAAMGDVERGDWFRSTGVAEWPITLTSGGETKDVILRFERGRLSGATVDGEAVPGLADAAPARGERRLVDGRSIWIDVDGRTSVFTEPDPFAGSGRADDPARIVAPVSGLIRTVAVERGGRVVSGQAVAMIEAMKMETAVVAKAAGRVRAVHALAGEQASAGELLVEIEPDADDRARPT